MAVATGVGVIRVSSVCWVGVRINIMLVNQIDLYDTSKAEQIVWAVGDTWVIKERYGWSRGSEPATENEVCQLFIRTGGVAELLIIFSACPQSPSPFQS